MSRTISLGVLESIQIASPCHADWDSMSGNDQVRFCSDCRLNVYNLSAMTREEAESLVLRTEGRLCARFYRRADGTVLTRDCPVGLRALRLKAAAGFSRFAGAIAAIVGSGVALGAGRSGWTTRLRQIEPFSTICEWISPAPDGRRGGAVASPERSNIQGRRTMSRRVSLDLLDHIGVASPCSADWDSMTGDDRVRFCSQCSLHVYNLSAMTREEATRLVQETEGRLCARFHRRADGTVLTRDCPVGLRALRARTARAVVRLGAAAACILGSGVALASGRTSSAKLRELEPFATISRWLSPSPPTLPMGKVAFMGDVCIPQTPAPATSTTSTSPNPRR